MKNLKLVAAIFAFGLASACAHAAEFYTYVPGNGKLTNNNPGGSGFAAVSVTGYTGVGSNSCPITP